MSTRRGGPLARNIATLVLLCTAVVSVLSTDVAGLETRQDLEGPIMCNPKAKNPPQLCPGGTKCPQCGQVACPCPLEPGPPPPPRLAAVPSSKQLAWQDLEVGAMLGFNLQSNCLATNGSAGRRSSQPCLCFTGDNQCFGDTPVALAAGRAHGWLPSPGAVAEWDPAELDTDAWASAARAFGARYVILVAQHMAGFSLWDTRTHNFSIAHTAYKGGGQDVVKDMVASCKKYGLKLGLFYSVHFNWWLGVESYRVGHPRIDHSLPTLTQPEYLEVAKAQLTELASRFGPEGPVELWFDGGTGLN
eukprot:COSAG05_NODE_5788_length_1088_cov_1.409505_1_plen_302_part_10